MDPTVPNGQKPNPSPAPKRSRSPPRPPPRPEQVDVATKKPSPPSAAPLPVEEENATPPMQLPPTPDDSPLASMSSVYLKLFENEVRRKMLFEVHEFHHSRKQLEKIGFRDSFREIASMPTLRARRSSNTPVFAQTRRLSSRSSSPALHTNTNNNNTTSAPTVSIGEKPLKSKASCKDLFGNEISPRLDTLERFLTVGGQKEEEKPPTPPMHLHMLGNLASQPPARTLEIVRGMRKTNSIFNGSASALQIFPLPRGGHSVQTRIGPIQVGLPPETIKDSMNVGLKFPTIFIIPQQRFHRWRMISVAEFEFPAYFNFFVLQRPVRLVTTKSAEVALRCVFQESLLGPVDLSLEAIADDFAPELSIDHRPRFRKERLYFGDNDINKLLEFIPLREAESARHRSSCLEADLGDDILVRLEASESEDSFVIIDRLPATAKSSPNAPAKRELSPQLAEPTNPAPEPFVQQQHPSPPARRRSHRRSLSDVDEFPCDLNRLNLENKGARRGSELGQADIASMHRESELARLPGLVELPNFRSFSRIDVKRGAFVPPLFGVTLLGTSHGFDRESSTTGFVVWINGKGVIVDPPPNSTPMLEMMGIAARQVQHVVITHCHADHDAGTMQKLMLEEHVTVLTTPTILKSFVRKYSAVSDIPQDKITSRFTFRATRVGEWLPLLGGEMRVFYSFHTIPTVGFQIRFGGKSLVYSGDTFFHPEEIARLATPEVDVLTKQRADNLINFPWDADLILHECGVAPIHTPLKHLGDLPEEVKKKLYLVHVTASSVAKDENLKGIQLAKDGTRGTLVLDVSSAPPVSLANSMLSWIKDSAPFTGLQNLESACDLLSVLTLHELKHGDTLHCEKRLVIIGLGSCVAANEAAPPYELGDCICDEPGKFIVTSNRFIYLTCGLQDVFSLPSREVATALLQWKTEMQRNEFGGMDLTSCLTRREQARFTRMFTRDEIHVLPKGTMLWEAGKALKQAYIILSGAVSLTYCVKDERKYDAPQHQESLLQFARLRRVLDEEPKPFLCDLPALYHDLPVRSTLRAESDQVRVYAVSAAQFLDFLRATPALLAKLHTDFTSEQNRVPHSKAQVESSSNSSSSEDEFEYSTPAPMEEEL